MNTGEVLSAGRRLALTALCLLCLLAAPRQMLAQAGQEGCGDRVHVANGDTLYKIAERCQTTIAALMKENMQLRSPDFLTVGMVLYLPKPDRPFRVYSRRIRYQEPPPAAGGFDYGEALGGVGFGGASSRSATGRFYEVRAGDTLADIARSNGTSIEALMGANPGVPSPQFIRPGMQLLLPDGEASFPRSAPDAYAAQSVTLSPMNGPPGSRILLNVPGFRPDVLVYLGIGRSAAEYRIVGRARADETGRVITGVTVPAAARDGDEWVFVVLDGQYRVQAVSPPFVVDRSAAWPLAGDGGQR